MLLLGHWFPNTIYLLLTSFSSSPACSRDLYTLLLLPVLAACSFDASSSWDRGAKVGLQHLPSITQPHSGLIFIVNLQTIS